MLRIARTRISTFLPADRQDEQPFTQYQRLVALVKKHLSPVTASVFAQPVLHDESDYVEWYSELQGQPEPLLSLPENQQLKVKELLTARLSSISKLAEQLPQLDPSSADFQDNLQKVVRFPGDKAIYVINDQPVIIFWGISDQTSHSVLSPTSSVVGSKPSLATPATKKTSRSLLRIGLLFLSIALLGGLFWLSKQPINWQDYNPFVDEYQLLLDEVNAAENDCSALENIYNNNALINKTEEKFVLLKKQVEVSLVNCDYQLLLDEVNAAKNKCSALKNIYTNNPLINNAEEKFVLLKKQVEVSLVNCDYQLLLDEVKAAENNCSALENIYTNNALINKSEEKFVLVKKQVEAKLANCKAYIQLKKEIESAQGDCPKLTDILNNNPYLQNPQEPFIELKGQLEKSVQQCVEFQQLKSEIDSAKDNCSALSKIRQENPRIQKPEGLFVSLKQQVDTYIANCTAYDTFASTIDKAQLDCQKLKQLATENALLKNPTGKFIKLKEKLNTYQNNCQSKQIENSVNLCPGERPKELAPELVVVFDASGSMAFPSDKHKLLQFEQKIQQQSTGQLVGQQLFQMIGVPSSVTTALGLDFKSIPIDTMRRLSPEKDSRMRGAKTAVNQLVQNTPSDMNIGLVVLKDCPGAQEYGFYSPAKRPQFLGTINNLQPEGGTPLGDAILKAGQMIDGVNKAATMVVISDGEESCNADPCAVARRLAAQKPHLTINVVDILGTGAGNCIAKATKMGEVFTANNMQDIINMTEKAASTAIPKNCRK